MDYQIHRIDVDMRGNWWMRLMRRLRLAPPVIPSRQYQVQGRPLEPGVRVIMDWSAEITGMVLDSPAVVSISLRGEDGITRNATISGDPRLGYALLDAMRTRSRLQ